MRRCAAGGAMLGDDLAQVLDAVAGEGGHAILTDAIDPEAAVTSRTMFMRSLARGIGAALRNAGRP